MSEISRLKVVFDTDVFISALLWKGTPHNLLIFAEKGSIHLYATFEMLGELEEVLNREKFRKRITELRTSVNELMMGVISLVEIVIPKKKVKCKIENNRTP